MGKGKAKKDPIRCPCCGETALLGPTHPPMLQEEILRTKGAPEWWSVVGWTLRWAKDRKLRWACQRCFKRGHALEAKPWLQTYLDFPPLFAYYDMRKRCESCNNPFVFSASEQHRWYEEYKFWVQSEPKHCLACRRLYRRHAKSNNDLAVALSKLDEKDPKQLAHVSELYLSIGSSKKAAEFLARAKNRAGGSEALTALLNSSKMMPPD